MKKLKVQRNGSSDEFQTPKEAILPLLPYLKKDWTIWECAWGKGSLAKHLEEKGFKVFGNKDIDFLTFQSENLGFNFDVIITNPPYCYDSETECLTKGGWKLIKDVSINEEVMSLDPSSLIISWDKVNEIISNDYKGDMIHFKQRMIDLLVTPNHRMYAIYIDGRIANKKRLYGEGRKKFSEDLIEARDVKQTHYLKRIGFKWIGKEEEFFTIPSVSLTYNKQQRIFNEIKIKIDDWVAFLGLWIAEGCTRGSKKLESENHKGKQKHLYEISIKQKEPNATKVRDLLNKLPFEVKRT